MPEKYSCNYFSRKGNKIVINFKPYNIEQEEIEKHMQEIDFSDPYWFLQDID